MYTNGNLARDVLTLQYELFVLLCSSNTGAITALHSSRALRSAYPLHAWLSRVVCFIRHHYTTEGWYALTDWRRVRPRRTKTPAVIMTAALLHMFHLH